MQIDVKRVYDSPSADDGQRVLVDRLWPRGISKEKAKLTVWLKEIAPSNELRQWYHKDMTQQVEFERRYREELRKNPAAVEELEILISKGKVTLLYASHDLEHNHAKFLSRYMRERKT